MACMHEAWIAHHAPACADTFKNLRSMLPITNRRARMAAGEEAPVTPPLQPGVTQLNLNPPKPKTRNPTVRFEAWQLRDGVWQLMTTPSPGRPTYFWPPLRNYIFRV